MFASIFHNHNSCVALMPVAEITSLQCNLALRVVNPFALRGTLELIVCYSYTFENNLGIKRKFNKYLKESCCLASNQHFSFKYFFRKCFCKLNIFKIDRLILAALSVNGLKRIRSYKAALLISRSAVLSFKRIRNETASFYHSDR